jgi:hypothetical protein
MIWWKNRPNQVPDDLDEAKEIRREASREIAELQAQAPFVKSMTQNLLARRAANHFGDSIQVTFVRR